MTAVIVGGDYIKQIEKIFAKKGVTRVEHWSGRKAGHLRKSLPGDTCLVVLLCDYLSHSLAGKVRDNAERRGLPVIYCRRSMGALCAKLNDFFDNGGLSANDAKPVHCCAKCSERSDLKAS